MLLEPKRTGVVFEPKEKSRFWDRAIYFFLGSILGIGVQVLALIHQKGGF